LRNFNRCFIFDIYELIFILMYNIKISILLFLTFLTLNIINF